METKTTSPILVTGASGYLASHLIKLLLENGYKVRGTVRSLANKEKYAFLYELAPAKKDNLELVEADLTNKASWASAVQGVEYIFHVASPIPPYVPKDDNEIIIPAIEGTLNVLEAALEKGVKKVVVTSSGLAIFTGNGGKVCTEEDWAKEEVCPAYPRSKLLAERAAWKFYEENKGKIEVTVVNPTMVLGPVFVKHGNSSETLIADILKGSYPGIIDLTVSVVDVRDVATAHYRAMFNENTNGKRFAASLGPVSFETIITSLKKEFSKYGYEVSDKHVSKEEAIASENAVIKRQVPLIGNKFNVSNERSVKELGMKYISADKMVIDMGYSLIKNGVIPDKTK